MAQTREDALSLFSLPLSDFLLVKSDKIRQGSNQEWAIVRITAHWILRHTEAREVWQFGQMQRLVQVRNAILPQVELSKIVRFAESFKLVDCVDA